MNLLTYTKRFLLILLLVCCSVLPWANATDITTDGDNETIIKLMSRIAQNPADQADRLKLAGIYYRLAGFERYFAVRSRLWTEPLYRRAAFVKKLPPVLSAENASCQQQLLQILDRDDNNRSALLMAGNYHLYMNQKEIACWYLRRALAADPSSRETGLVLADYYLDQWQPGEVFQLLHGNNTPEASLRKGTAMIQAGEYPLALGYLLQADPLPPLWQMTRDINLLKVYLALKDSANFTSLVQTMVLRNETEPEIIGAMLLKELQGWAAFWKGETRTAQNLWDEGRKLYPEFYWWNTQWNLNSTWFASTTVSASKLASIKENNYLQSAGQILQGRQYWENGAWDAAEQSFGAALKADPTSLVGLLMAGNLQFQKDNPTRALEIYNLGLKMNPKFIPLLTKRIEVYQKLGGLTEAERDQELIRSITVQEMNSGAKLQFVPAWREDGGLALVIHGNIQYLNGIWFSPDGETWEWLPWWGGPLRFDATVKQCWLVPVGKGLDGEAYFLDNPHAAGIQSGPEPPEVLGQQVVFKFTAKVKMVLAIHGNHSASFISEEFSQSHTVPAGLFHHGGQKFEGWLQTENGEWCRIEYNVESENTGPEMVTGQNNIQNPGNVAEQDRGVPRLMFVSLGGSNSDNIGVCWGADQPVTTRLEALSDQGDWKELPVVTDSRGIFWSRLSGKNTVYCRIILESQWGNHSAIYPVTELNRRLSAGISPQFIINAGSGFVNQRNVEIQPALIDKITGESKDNFQWSLSNDLVVWSPWSHGSAPVRWRLNAGDGLKLIYIRYKSFDSEDNVKVGVAAAELDTFPPELEKAYCEPAGTGDPDELKTLIHFKFNEPVAVKALVHKSGTLTETVDPGPNNYRPEVSTGLVVGKAPETNDILELEVLDQAGNPRKYIIEMNAAGGIQKTLPVADK